MSKGVYKAEFLEPEVINSLMTMVENSNNTKVNISEDMKEPLSDVIKKKLDVVYQFRIPQESAKNKEMDKSMEIFLSFHQDNIDITLAKPGLSDYDCATIVTEFIQSIYKEAVHKELPKECIRLEKQGEFSQEQCAVCNKLVLVSFSAYRCPICGDTYCLDHRHPLSHNCNTFEGTDGIIRIEGQNVTSKSTLIKPKVKIIQSLCG